jgi:hypothetical protein
VTSRLETFYRCHHDDQVQDMSDTPSGRWQPAGPNADEPPWAGREHEPREDVDEPDTTTEAEGSADEDMSDEEQAARRELDELRGMPMPPAPPKRTGVFLDPDDLREHVGGLLRVMLGGYQVDAWGNFTFTHEGARVFVTVGGSPIGPQVGVFSVTNLDIELTPPLAGFLLTTNHKLGFGSFSYDPENKAVWLRHTLLGTTLDGPELQAAVAAVASTAAHLDDKIAERFGGRTFEDSPEEVQQATKPPETPQEAYPNASGYL